jgi:hypothetical protein
VNRSRDKNQGLTPFPFLFFGRTILPILGLISTIQGCDAGDPQLAERSATGNASLATSADPNSKPARFVEGNKVDGDTYVSIPYELRLSKMDGVCRSLTSIVNQDLKESPYVNYSNPKHFVPWQLLKEPVFAPAAYKAWQEKYRPPLAKLVVDIDNDGEQEYVYVITTRKPLPKQRLAIFSNEPQTRMTITDGPSKDLANFADFLRNERHAGNPAGDVASYQPLALVELPDYSASNPSLFRRDVAAYFVYKHADRNYLVADTLDYNPQSQHWYETNPWLLLFSVSSDGALTNTCILRRTR